MQFGLILNKAIKKNRNIRLSEIGANIFKPMSEGEESIYRKFAPAATATRATPENPFCPCFIFLPCHGNVEQAVETSFVAVVESYLSR